MKINSKSKGLFLIGVILFIAIVLGIFLSVPDTYSYDSKNGSNTHYVSSVIFLENSVWKTTIYPECEGPRVAEPSEGFGVAYLVCDKRDLSIVQIESVSEEDGVKTYKLKYSNPGEKGSHYRETLVQDSDTVIYNKNTYTKSSFLISLVRYFLGE